MTPKPLALLSFVAGCAAWAPHCAAQAGPDAEATAVRASLRDMADARAYRRSLATARTPVAADRNLFNQLTLARRFSNGGSEASIGLQHLTRNTLDPHEVNSAVSTPFDKFGGGGVGAGFNYRFR
ncbi:MAG TPA: hypothetical protein VFC47_12710 [Caulobacteraceae bacterium]|nr:hypothetical protein [Caulobacteraceae bacterium]